MRASDAEYDGTIPKGPRIQVPGLGPKKNQTKKQTSPGSVINSRPRANSGFGRARPQPQEARTNRVQESQEGRPVTLRTLAEQRPLPTAGLHPWKPVKAGRAKLLLLGKKGSRPTELLQLAPPSRSEPIP